MRATQEADWLGQPPTEPHPDAPALVAAYVNQSPTDPSLPLVASAVSASPSAPALAVSQPECDQYGRLPGEDVHYWINRNLKEAAELKARIDWLCDVFAAEHSRIDTELEHELLPLNRRYEAITDSVKRWHLDHQELKTRPTPHGTISLVVYEKPKIKIDDRDAVVEWAKVHRPEIVVAKTTETVTHDVLVKVAEVKKQGDGHKVVTADGEVIPGVSVYVQEPSWTFRPIGHEDF